MKPIRTTLAALALAGLLLHGLDAMAQFRLPGGGGARGGARTAAPQRAEPEASRVNQQEELVEELRQDLQLRPGQVAAWDYYLDKVRAMGTDIARESARARAQPGTTALQRIDRSVDVARDRLTALEEIASAAKKLYAILEPEQRSIADARLAAVIPQTGEGALPRGAPGAARLRSEGR